MKRRILFLLFIIVTSLSSYGQKYDYTWMAGYFSQHGYDTGAHYWFGISTLDFGQQPVNITRDSLGISFDRSNSSISDADGNYLFSCNGIQVYNSFDEKIADSLSTIDSSYELFQLYPTAFALGIPDKQYHLIVPNPDYNNLFDIFYIYIDTFMVPGGAYIDGKRLLRATVNMSANNEHGLVNSKDVEILRHQNNIAVAACKHANGKDWWLTTNRTGSNCYDFLYYTGDDSLRHSIECAGDSIGPGAINLRFSPDGSKFVSIYTSVNIFDFDRCSGSLSLKEIIDVPEFTDSLHWWPTTLEFSPDNRFLYVCNDFRIYQFDMTANPIASSRVTVGVYDASHSCPFPQTFYYAQLAPDGKIYMNSGNTNYCIGVIGNPNGLGASCNFNDTAINLPTFISGLPYYPNYRLGALPGSPCDTLTGLNETARALKEKILKVFPNPAGNTVTVDYGFTDWSKGDVRLTISDELGRVVYEQALPKYSGFQKINVSTLAAGTYFVYLERNGNTVAAEKMMKE